MFSSNIFDFFVILLLDRFRHILAKYFRLDKSSSDMTFGYLEHQQLVLLFKEKSFSIAPGKVQ